MNQALPSVQHMFDFDERLGVQIRYLPNWGPEIHPWPLPIENFGKSLDEFMHNPKNLNVQTVDPTPFIAILGHSPSQDVLNKALFLLIHLMKDPSYSAHLCHTIIESLLKIGADPNTLEEAPIGPYETKKVKGTLLMIAIGYQDLHLIRLLIHYGAHLDPKKDDRFWRELGSRYIEVAKQLTHVELRKVLCKFRRPYDDLLKETGLLIREENSLPNVKLWLDMGADISAVVYKNSSWPNGHRSLLTTFIIRHNVPVVKLLIAHGAHLDPVFDRSEWLKLEAIGEELTHDELRRVLCKIPNAFDALLLQSCGAWPFIKASKVQLWLDMGTSFDAMQAGYDKIMKCEEKAESMLKLSEEQRAMRKFYSDPQEVLKLARASLQAVEKHMNQERALAFAMALHPRLGKSSSSRQLGPDPFRGIGDAVFEKRHPQRR